MKKIIALVSVLGLPAVALAFDNTMTIDSLFMRINQLLSYVLPLLIAVAVIYFVWGVVQFIASSDEEAKKNGRGKIIKGLIGLFIIVAFWGIIGIVMKTFNIGQGSGQDIVPCMPQYDAYGRVIRTIC